MTYIWIAVVIFSIVAEAMTTDLIAIWFMPSALICMVLAMCHVPLWIQLVVFFVLVVLSLILSEKWLRKYLKARPTTKTNADSLLGKTAVVTERIDNEAQTGAVRIDGLEWSARSVSDTITLEKDTLVAICEISGVKLICEPK